MGANNDGERWRRAGVLFLLIFAAADLVSISVAQSAAALMGVCWIGQHVALRRRPDLSKLAVPLGAFIVASLLAAIFSKTPVASLVDSKDLLHIAIFFGGYWLFSADAALAPKAFRAIGAVGLGVALVGFGQAAARGIDIHNRISGFNDMYMTYAGLQMVAIAAVGATVLFDWRGFKKDGWMGVSLLLMGGATLLSLTRNTWLGIGAAVGVLAALKKPSTLLLLPVIAVGVYAAAPEGVQNRIASIADPEQPANRERLLLWSAGLAIAADHPILGVGQNVFPLVYPDYRHPDVAEPNISHLHNNVLELLVERGAVGLAAWLSVWVTALFLMIRRWRQGAVARATKTALAAGIGGVTAFLVAGMFEYNFGDSEIQMLVYLLLAAGVAAATTPATEEAAPTES